MCGVVFVYCPSHHHHSPDHVLGGAKGCVTSPSRVEDHGIIYKIEDEYKVTPSNLESLFRMALLKRENASSAAHVVEALEDLKNLKNKAMEFQEYEVGENYGASWHFATSARLLE